jgi:hypothetical protein
MTEYRCLNISDFLTGNTSRDATDVANVVASLREDERAIVMALNSFTMLWAIHKKNNLSIFEAIDFLNSMFDDCDFKYDDNEDEFYCIKY